ncbi:MAG TPA: DMT family transporter [Rhabdochlamydiaceae bacterium]|jgi:drug/metabolite transporter (DMT)-like permease
MTSLDFFRLAKTREEFRIPPMLLGVVFALAACFIWGLIFVVPQFLSGFSSIEVALGRYCFYGIVSCLIFCKLKFQGRCKYPRSIWVKSLYFSLISTIGYYTFVVLALRYSTPAICALVLGISPITIAFYGNWKQRETTFKSLILPSLLILLGLAIINVPHLAKAASPSSYVLGLACCVMALIAWSWYVVANSRFLKQHPHVRSSDWSTLIGVSTLIWVIIFALALSVFESNSSLDKHFAFTPELINFLLGSAILGLLCSWVGAYLWNKASLNLPVSLAGQLTIFETIFGVIFVYILQQQTPPFLESIGIAILLIAIVYGIRQFSKRKGYGKELKPH